MIEPRTDELSGPVGGANSPSDLAEWRELARMVRRAAIELTAEQQVVLALVAEGDRHPEIADILGVSEGTVVTPACGS